ncbi:MAG: hypothetical protein MUP45_03150 [Candidatus Marinimicrobia bacterium]|nr:hypothetical protein [Candidatus Neomarinimicrobiota bacterium]
MLVILILIFALSLRVIWLDRIPTGINNDELDHVMDAKAIFYSGKDLTGTWSPLSLTPPPHSYPKSELPGLVISPIIGPLKISLFSAHLPFALAGTAFVLLVFLISLKLFDFNFALIASLIAALNPASILFSRTGYESPLALTLYLLAFYLIIISRGWKILLAFPFLFLAFYSYIGTKIVIVPFVLTTCFFSWWVINKKKFLKQYLILTLLSLLLFSGFLISFQHQPTGIRTKELLSPFHPSIANMVDAEQRTSVDSPLTRIFNNKLVIFSKLFVEKYLGIFSANFLFLFGEGQMFFSVWKHGMFYYLDFIFFFLGFAYLFLKRRNLWLFFVVLLMIAPLPSAFSLVGTEYAERAILIYPSIIIFIAGGIYYSIDFLKKKNNLFFSAFIAILIILYALQFLNFMIIYHLRNPIYNSEGSGFGVRVLVKYTNLAKLSGKRVVVISRDSMGFFKHYLFYSGVFDREALPLIRDKISSDDYSWENIIFLSNCDSYLKVKEDDVIISLAELECFDKKEYPHWLSIPRLGDAGEIFRIYNDQVCRKYSLNPYPRGIKFTDFKVENLTSERFCQKFITDLTDYSSEEIK